MTGRKWRKRPTGKNCKASNSSCWSDGKYFIPNLAFPWISLLVKCLSCKLGLNWLLMKLRVEMKKTFQGFSVFVAVRGSQHVGGGFAVMTTWYSRIGVELFDEESNLHSMAPFTSIQFPWDHITRTATSLSQGPPSVVKSQIYSVLSTNWIQRAVCEFAALSTPVRF